MRLIEWDRVRVWGSYPKMASLYVSGSFRMPSATTGARTSEQNEQETLGNELLRISGALEISCLNIKATAEKRHELSSGTT